MTLVEPTAGDDVVGSDVHVYSGVDGSKQDLVMTLQETTYSDENSSFFT